MNLKLSPKLLGLAAAATLFLGTMAPVAADVNSATTPLVVTLADNGVFEVSFQNVVFGSGATVNAVTGATLTGSFILHYKDTKSYRGGFDTTLNADNFTSSLAIPNATVPGNYSIPANNLEITRVYDTAQGRCTCGGPRIGDIGATSNGNDNDHSGGPYLPADHDSNFGPNLSYHEWTTAVNRTLDGTPLVGFGFAGPGTASTAFDGSSQPILIKLTIPVGQPATTYTSTLHVTVAFGWQ